jgi:hypothetical protein
MELGHRKRLSWATEQLGLTHDRTLADIEKGRRNNYDASTIAFVESAYGWSVGDVEKVLAGGEPTPRAVQGVTVSTGTASGSGSVTPAAEDEPYAADEAPDLRDVPLDTLLAEVARRARDNNPEAR